MQNFSSSIDTTVMVIVYTSPSNSTTRHFYGEMANFEIVVENAIGVMVFVPLNTNKSINFVLNYY